MLIVNILEVMIRADVRDINPYEAQVGFFSFSFNVPFFLGQLSSTAQLLCSYVAKDLHTVYCCDFQFSWMNCEGFLVLELA